MQLLKPSEISAGILGAEAAYIMKSERRFIENSDDLFDITGNHVILLKANFWFYL